MNISCLMKCFRESCTCFLCLKKTFVVNLLYIRELNVFPSYLICISICFVISILDLAGGYPSPLNYHFFPKSCCTQVIVLFVTYYLASSDVSYYRRLYSGQLMKSFAMEFQMPGPLIFTHRANHLSHSCLNLMLLCLILIYICKVNHRFLSKCS